MKKYYMVGNTHFDPVWEWKWDEAMASIRATFRSALDRMKEDDSFIYSFSTPPVFEWIKDTEPEMFAEIKQRVAEGRWDIAEAWWLQPDCFSACGESYIRQGLYGQRYLKENFGKMSSVVFNVDSFGHNLQTPQMLKKSEIDYYCFVRPESRHIELEKPYFKWQGIDGSSVLCYRAESIYEPLVEEVKEKLEYLNGDKQMIIYGVTDHGGAPTKKAISDINNNPDMEFSTVERFFEENGDTDYVVRDELLTGDFGPYSNGTDIKKLNKRAENALLNAEKSSVISGRNSKDALVSCWKDVMFNQFHDILGGASIKDAYQDAEALSGRAIATAEYITHTNLQYVTSQIKTPGKNPDNIWNIVVWNLNGVEYDGYIEAEVQWAHEFPWYDKSIELEDDEGNTYRTQIIREKSVIPRFRSRFVFKAKIPAMGYKAFKLIKTENDEKIIHNDKQNPFLIETEKYVFSISKEDGSIEKIENKETKEILHSNILSPTCYLDEGDAWAFNIEEYGKCLGKFNVKDARVIEDGIHRTKIKVTSEFEKSLLFVYYTFYKEENYVDVYYKVNWNEKYMTFKLNVNKNTDNLKVGIPAGSIVRKDKKGDAPMSGWIKSPELAIISDSIFSYDTSSDRIGLTVLRSPIYGDLRIEDIDLDVDYDIMSQGITDGKIRILLDKNASIEKESEIFANDCIVIDESNHDGKLLSKGSFLNISDGISLMALKYAEDSNAVIIRVVEHTGQARTASIMFEDREYSFEISGYEIKTFEINDSKIKEVNMLEF